MVKDRKPKYKVSFILGIYNAERTISDCLEGILSQNNKKNSYEIIVIDGGSTDSTLNIIKSYQKKNSNIYLHHNPKKLSEGKGMSKDMGVKLSKGEIIIFLDHDNIILHDDWLEKILIPFRDKRVMASQSMLKSCAGDTLFLEYVNVIGVEDPFAVPYSFISQIRINPKKFNFKDGFYYFDLNKDNIYFIGANGCAFRKEVFDKLSNYTRDVDVSASMANLGMRIASHQETFLHHKTASDFFGFMKKKGVYFYRFINNEYSTKDFSWTNRGSGFNGKIMFFLMIAYNISFLGPMVNAVNLAAKKREGIWLLHPFYLFFITLEYGLITMFRMSNFIRYFSR